MKTIKISIIRKTTAAVDLRCPNCGENLGKATQLTKLVSCGTCGHKNIRNPAGDDDNY